MKQVAIITGGSSGIGKSLVLKYAREGYAVAFTGRSAARLKETEEALKEIGASYLALKLDAASEEDNDALVSRTVEEFGSIDVLICNAGISMRALFEDIDLVVFRQLMEINFYGAIYAVKAGLPHLLKSKGSIIGISSINGRRSTPARSAYTSSKFALEGFLETLRTEVMTRGVHVLVVRPGFTSSNIRNAALTADGKSQGESPRDEKEMMSADEVAEHTFSAEQKGKRDIVLTKDGKLALFFNKLVPSWVDKKIYERMKKEPDSPLK